LRAMVNRSIVAISGSSTGIVTETKVERLRERRWERGIEWDIWSSIILIIKGQLYNKNFNFC